MYYWTFWQLNMHFGIYRMSLQIRLLSKDAFMLSNTKAKWWILCLQQPPAAWPQSRFHPEPKSPLSLWRVVFPPLTFHLSSLPSGFCALFKSRWWWSQSWHFTLILLPLRNLASNTPAFVRCSFCQRQYKNSFLLCFAVLVCCQKRVSVIRCVCSHVHSYGTMNTFQPATEDKVKN